MNRRNEKWTVDSGCMQTQAFIVLTQSWFVLQEVGVFFVLIQKAKYWALLEVL